MSDARIGSCLCGAVTCQITLPTNWIAHCHCSVCRRAHGAPFVTWVSVPRAHWKLTSGTDQLKQYRSSDNATRSFCGTCGTPMFFESGRWAGEFHIARALFAEALDREPQVHAYFSDKASWIDVRDDLPRRGGKSGVQPL